MLRSDTSVVRIAKWMALAVAILVSLGTPTGYFYFGYQHHKMTHTAQAQLMSKPIERLISHHPEIWFYKTDRLNGIISRMRTGHHGDNLRRITRLDGGLIVQYPEAAQVPEWPVIAVKRKLLDFGRPVAAIEIVHSLRGLLVTTLVIAVASIVGGLLIYWFLSVFPLRMLESSWQRISYLARYDTLTGLANRATLHDLLERTIADNARRSGSVVVHCIDLDHFKDVNDTLGHAAGDKLLKKATERMRGCIREGDTLARFGGDEFVIIQKDVADPQDAASLAERIIAELSQPFDLDGRKTAIGVSIGMAAHSNDDEVGADQLLKNADLALYQSKNAGRGTYHFFQEDLDRQLRARLTLETDLRLALQDEQFELHYQPKLDPASERIIGVEALLRWHHPERGPIPPNVFIPVAEKMGIMGPLTAWVLEKACYDGLAWDPLHIAVNVPASLIQQQDFIEVVRSVLQRSDLPPHRLELEVTEEVLLSDAEQAITALEQLKALGVNIAMDDFGTGYSSLSYMRKFRFDKIKIDRSFVTDIGQHKDAQAIVRAIVSMCRALDMHVNAEGVETREEAEVLVREGCDEVQGFLYARPVPAAEIQGLLDASNTPSQRASLAHVA